MHEPSRRDENDRLVVSKAAVRVLISIAAGFGGFLLSFTYGCDDRGGVPGWERCITAFGTPIPDWSAWISVAIGMAVGVAVWWLLRVTPPNRHK